MGEEEEEEVVARRWVIVARADRDRNAVASRASIEASAFGEIERRRVVN